MLEEMNSKEALIEVSKSCKALAREFGRNKVYKQDAKALNVLKDTILENAKLKKAIEIMIINGVQPIVLNNKYRGFNCFEVISNEEANILNQTFLEVLKSVAMRRRKQRL